MEENRENRGALELLRGPRCLTTQAQATLCFVTSGTDLFGFVEIEGSTARGKTCV
jgi:hypothetical protein